MTGIRNRFVPPPPPPREDERLVNLEIFEMSVKQYADDYRKLISSFDSVSNEKKVAVHKLQQVESQLAVFQQDVVINKESQIVLQRQLSDMQNERDGLRLVVNEQEQQLAYLSQQVTEKKLELDNLTDEHLQELKRKTDESLQLARLYDHSQQQLSEDKSEITSLREQLAAANRSKGELAVELAKEKEISAKHFESAKEGEIKIAKLEKDLKAAVESRNRNREGRAEFAHQLAKAHASGKITKDAVTSSKLLAYYTEVSEDVAKRGGVKRKHPDGLSSPSSSSASLFGMYSSSSPSSPSSSLRPAVVARNDESSVADLHAALDTLVPKK